MLSFLWIGLILQLVRAEDKCTPTPSGGFGTCRTCGAIINGKEYCSQCNDSGSLDSSCAPTNGVCTSDNTECAQKQDGVCTRCAYRSFMYKGGCYKDSQAPGNTMCQTTDSNGLCTQAKDGYFVPPGADASHQSVIPCGDEEVVTIGSSKQYRGIPNCLTCTAPNDGTGAETKPRAPTCNTCKDGFFVDASKESTCTACPANCLTCADGTAERCKSCTADTHFLGAADNGEGRCISCGDATQGSGAWRGVAGCAKCTKPQSAGPATCTECAADKYLKTDSGATSCVSAGECKDGFFPTTDSTGKRVCTTCGDTANGGIEDCAKCSLKAASAGAGPLVTCSECSSKKLSPLGDACLTACPAGTYPNDNGVCAPCHSSCVSCENSSAEASCTACYPGSVLSRTSGDAGRCTPECTGEFVAHCAAGQCDGVVGGSKYCKKCDNGYVPINGICTAAGAAGRGASVCTAGDGVCTACSGGNHALLVGGCYDTSKVPGSSVCETADGAGACTRCTASGQQPSGGSCPACSDGCAKCSDSSACTECLPGYYRGADDTCFKCTSGDGAADSPITGVADCISCVPPASPPGPVICYVKEGGAGTSGGNRGGLSTGSITGIAVAAIVVVGGLVGFLCWWFLCRSKAQT